LRFQELLYSRPVRRLGLWFSAHDLPVATLNTYLQRFIPQPKHLMGQLDAAIHYAGPSLAVQVVMLEQGDARVEELSVEATLSRLLQPRGGIFAFQPGPLLTEEMSRWGGRDWQQEEKAIVHAALQDCKLLRWRSTADSWWKQFPELLTGRRSRSRESLISGEQLAISSEQ
jgi:hypothetical protein